ncbi:MAG TPA: hypothetical protein VMT98_03760 [Verrucomicrobiae bacterium]|nr:hypothetical protein [Verrucomicrobiae bacterium]
MDSADALRLRSRLAVFLVAVGVLLFCSPMLLDPDYFWHLETGRLIAQNRALPAVDPFSFRYEGQHWVLHEWLFQLILYGAYAGLGDIGVRLLCAATGASFIGVVFVTARRLSGRTGFALVLTLSSLILLYPFIEPRPQIATLLLFALFLRALLFAKYFDEWRMIRWLPAIMALWVNLHGGYAMGLALVWLFAATEWVRLLASARTALKAPRLRELSIVAVLCLLASFLNPDGPGHLLYPLQIVNLEATRVLSEWQPTTFGSLYGKLYFLCVGLFALCLIYGRRRPDLLEFCLSGLMIAAGFASLRHVPFALLTMIFMASRAVREGLLIPVPAARIAAWWPSRRRPAGAAMSGGRESLLNLAAGALLILGAAIYYPSLAAKQDVMLRKAMPVGAVDFMQVQGIDGRMFNSLHFGGYLIHRFEGRLPVFIDGRTDLYGDRLFREHLDIERGRDGWDGLLEKYGIDLILCPPAAQIRKLLLDRGDFALVYEDQTAVILLKREVKYGELIRQFGH